MVKPRVTVAAVVAAHDVFDNAQVQDGYFQMSSQEQRDIRLGLVRQALVAAQLADLQNPSPQSNLLWRILAYLEGCDPKATSGGERNSDLREAVRKELEASK